jgi:hypothetical protein
MHLFYLEVCLPLSHLSRCARPFQHALMPVNVIGARCEPGCVCSNELWVYHLTSGNNGDSNLASTTLSTSDDTTSSPTVAPSSSSLDSSIPNGGNNGNVNGMGGWQQIKTSIAPMRRYKQTVVAITQNTLAPAPPGLKGFTPSLPSRVDLYLFGYTQ